MSKKCLDLLDNFFHFYPVFGQGVNLLCFRNQFFFLQFPEGFFHGWIYDVQSFCYAFSLHFPLRGKQGEYFLPCIASVHKTY